LTRHRQDLVALDIQPADPPIQAMAISSRHLRVRFTLCTGPEHMGYQKLLRQRAYLGTL